MKVVIIVAHTIDGFIARKNTELIDWTSKEDKEMFSAETKKGGVVIMGETTFKTLGRPLKDRLNIVLSLNPEKEKSIEGSLEFRKISPRKLIAELEAKKFKTVFICGGSYTYTQFLKAKLVDEIWISFEPVIFGKGLSNFSESVYNVRCSLIKSIKLNSNSVQLRYKIHYE